MLITKDFVYVHAPKTGGSFVTDVLFRLYEATWGPLRLLEYRLFGQNVYQHHCYGTFIHRMEKHSPVSDIPEDFSDLAILGTVREPLDLLVSQYEFRWWQRTEFIPYYRRTPVWSRLSDSFPSLSFSDFLVLMDHAYLPPAWLSSGLGYALFLFVRFYCRDARLLIEAIPTMEAYEDRLLRIQEGVKGVTFISTSQLNAGLYEYLSGVGYRADDLSFILAKQPVHPLGRGRTAAQTCDKYFTDSLRHQTMAKERLLTDLLPTLVAAA